MHDDQFCTQCNIDQSCQVAWLTHVQLVSERDKALRAAVLGAFEVLYAREGESAVWTLAGPLTDQQRSLIEERFRFAAKQAAKAASHRRLESNGNASDQSDVIPAHQPPRWASRPPAPPDIMKGLVIVSLYDAFLKGTLNGLRAHSRSREEGRSGHSLREAGISDSLFKKKPCDK